MPQLDQDQRELTDARATHARAQDSLFRTRQRLARIDKQLRDLQRTASPNAPEGGAAGRKLAQEKRRLTAQLREDQAAVGVSREGLAAAAGRFDAWSDPRRKIGRAHV